MPATITTLPTPPSRTDPSTFSTKADAFLGALPTFGTECNALAAEVTTNANTASTAASDTLTMKNDVTAMKNLTEGYKNTAESSATAAVNAYDSFDDRYLGSKANDPTLDNDGNTLLVGALYWNSTSSQMRAWSGSAWSTAYLPAGAYVTLTGVETVANKTFTNYTETVYTLAGTDINPANGSIQSKTLSVNTTFTESIADGQSVVLMLNPSTYTTTWPTISWVNTAGTGAAPILKASAMNTIVLWQVAGTLYGNWVGSL